MSLSGHTMTAEFMFINASGNFQFLRCAGGVLGDDSRSTTDFTDSTVSNFLQGAGFNVMGLTRD